MLRPSLSIPCLALLAAGCGSGFDVAPDLGTGRIEAELGPSGGLLRGAAGTDLQGFSLDIPAGALRRRISVTVSSGPEIAVPGTTPASVAVQIDVDPDPGTLLETALVTFAVDLSGSRAVEDLVVVSRPPPAPSALTDPTGRRGVLSSLGSYDRVTRVFRAPVHALHSHQVRLTIGSRGLAEAQELVDRGFEALARMTDASVVEADFLFAEAQAADPFSPAANLLRALSRIAVLLNDRTDDGPGLDSVGEILTAIGLDVGSQSLATRTRLSSWPRRLRVPAGAPSASEVTRFARERLRPAIELALRDLDQVEPGAVLSVTLPSTIALPGVRELDTTDIELLRALLAGAAFVLDLLDDLDLEADPTFLTSAAGRASTLAELLARFPSFGRLRAILEPRTEAALEEALTAWSEAFDFLSAETDAQGDDLVVFASSMTPERRDLWRSNLRSALVSLRADITQRISLGPGRGSVLIDLGRSLPSFDPRLFVPELVNFMPLAGSLPDPTLGGMFPDLTQDRATEIVQMANRHQLPKLAVVADGDLSEWNAASEALRPPDPLGDAGSTGLRGLDLHRVFVADSGDEVGLRLRVEDDDIAFRAGQRTVYSVTIRELRKGSLAPGIVVDIALSPGGPEVTVRRDGLSVEVRHGIAVAGGDLELTLDRSDLLGQGQPTATRVVRVSSEGLDLARGVADGDRTRPVVADF